MALAARPRQSRNPLPVQVEQSNVAVIVRDRDHPTGGHHEPIHGGICPDGGKGGAHVAQLPHLDGAVVRTGHDLVVAGEDRRGDAPGRKTGF